MFVTSYITYMSYLAYLRHVDDYKEKDIAKRLLILRQTNVKHVFFGLQQLQLFGI